MLPSRYRLLEVSLGELQQQMMALAALSPGHGWVRVSLILSATKGYAALSFHLPDGAGCLSGNVHFRLNAQDTKFLFCVFLLRSRSWHLHRSLLVSRRGPLRLRVKRLDAAGLKLLEQAILALHN